MPDQGIHARGILPDLEELCRIHDIGVDLIDRSDDLDDLLDRKRIATYIGELAMIVKDGREESLDRLLDTERPEV